MNFKKIVSLFAVLAGLAGVALGQQGQATLLQTTLASAVTGPAFYSGTTPTIQSTIFLASTTGIAAPLLPGTPVSIIYVDREAMAVWSVNTSLNAVVVSRGYLGTYASPHVTGQMVLVSNLYATTNAFGANPLPSGFFPNDPPEGGTCSAGAPTIPWVNVLTGAQWLCSSQTNTWVPGWNNPLSSVSSAPVNAVTAAVAGAQPIFGPLFSLSGTNAISSFTIPIGFNATAAGYGTFCIIPTGAFTTTATNNITKASTAVVGQTLCFTWNAATSKFTASY